MSFRAFFPHPRRETSVLSLEKFPAQMVGVHATHGLIVGWSMINDTMIRALLDSGLQKLTAEKAFRKPEAAGSLIDHAADRCGG